MVFGQQSFSRFEIAVRCVIILIANWSTRNVDCFRKLNWTALALLENQLQKILPIAGRQCAWPLR